MNKENKTITIDLDKLDSTEVREEGELIFQDQFDLLVSKIRRKAQENSDWLKAQEPCGSKKKGLDEETRGVPSCFFIDGTRGSGKSTLMRAVRDALVKGKFKEDEENKICLYPLADVDPTELGRGENFFLYLLARIYRLLDKCFKKRDESDDKVEQIRGAMEALRKMSGGLQVLMDSDGALKESDNPDFFLETCVDKCANSAQLRKKLCELLGAVAKIVGKEIFLVTIDDADLNFSKCEDVLEYVRKYMQTPRLIFLFAGDMQLYSHVVRGMHIENFREKQLKYDTSHSENRNQMQDRLEDQYLHKMFPVDNRVQTYSLKMVFDLVGEPKIRRDEKDVSPQYFTLYVGNYLSPFMKAIDERNFIDILCEMPMRSVFFFLRYLSKFEDPLQSANLSDYVWRGIQNLILTPLLKYNVDYERLGTEKIERLQKAIFRFYDATQQWNTDLSTLSASADSSAKFVALYLNGIVGLHTQTLSEKLCYWCACFPAWQAVRELYLQTSNGQKSHELVEACLKLGNGNNQSKWANLACAAMALKESQVLSYERGTICLFNDDRLQDNEQGYAARLGMWSLVAALDALKEKANKKTTLFTLAFLSSLCRLDDEKGAFYYLSVYHLLMKIVEWMNLDSFSSLRQDLKSDKTEKTVLREVIRKHLAAMYIVPSTQRFQQHETRTFNSVRKYHVVEGISDDKIVDEMMCWLADCPSFSFVTSAFDFSRSWEIFMAKCGELTSSYQKIYEKEENCPRAGTILQKYMEAAEIALSSCLVDGEKNLLSHVTSFPLWKVLKNPPRECLNLLNSAYIGDYIDLSSKNKMDKLLRAYEEKLNDISTIEQNKASLNQKFEEAKTILSELLQEKEAKAAEQNLRKGKVNEFKEEQKKVQNELDRLMFVENDVFHNMDVLNRDEKWETEQKNRADKKWALLNNSLMGKNKDVVSYSVLDAELKKEQALIERFREGEFRRKHESIVELIEEVRQELEHAEREKCVSSVWKDACETKERWESNCEERLNKVDDCKIQARKIKSEMQKAEKKLLEIKANIKLFRNAAVDAEIASELAKLKYERMQQEVARVEIEMDALEKSLTQAKTSCKAAKKAYEEGKKHKNGTPKKGTVKKTSVKTTENTAKKS